LDLKTYYKIDDIPHPEHPAPQAMRDGWLNLNGKWRLKRFTADGKENFSSEIIVPFSPETLNSGIESGFNLKKDELLVYSREFSLQENETSGKIILHFGAVDSECDVFINDIKVGEHVGGFTPFSFEVTSAVNIGENTITVKVKDNALYNSGARGKQSLARGAYWYTPQSGIWQTVWLEFMPKISIDAVKITPLLDLGTVKLNFSCPEQVTVEVFDNEALILRESGYNEIMLKYDFEKWSPENPKLYNLTLSCPSGDKIKSYFGYRSYSIVTDKKGKKRLGLNRKPYFFNGVLDQGYWSDGMLTYPSEKAIVDELTMLKNMGYNTVRKHIKIEPLRWYYLCDKIGLTVWQDFVNGGGDYIPSHVTVLPFLGFKHRDDDYKYFAREDKRGREEFIQSIKETVNALYNTACVSVYVPFNEGWGQFDSEKITKLTRELDPTRIIDSVSGWHDQGKKKTPILSLHTYYTPLKVPRDPRPVLLSEFGGYSMKISENAFSPEKEFGYKKFKSFDKLEKAIKKLYLKKLKPLIKKGLSGAIYTQVSDVEEETNGLVTYDRKVQKISTEVMKSINDELWKEWLNIIEN